VLVRIVDFLMIVVIVYVDRYRRKMGSGSFDATANGKKRMVSSE
jgi:hypothetical protein